MQVGISTHFAMGMLTHSLAAPHVGHLYTMVLSDILKRWQVLSGRKAVLCTGTDENGIKVSSDDILEERTLYSRLLRFSRQLQMQAWSQRHFATRAPGFSRYVATIR